MNMVQSINRAMKIISILISDENKPSWPITELAAATSLPLGTLHRIMATLITHGLVMQEPVTKHYRAGYAWIEIGLRLLDKLDFRHVARPVMERLAQEVEESIYLNIPEGLDSIPIEKVDSPLIIRIAENLGERIPMPIGAPNKAILAYSPKQEAERIVSQVLPPEEQQAFFDQLTRIKQAGFAVSYGERTEGTVAVAAPILSYHKTVLAALSINAPSFRVTEDRLSLLIDAVKKAAAEISAKIGSP
jgi:DNA-binding IclR family transcriptional regulator